jgi:hypothetical protein
MRAPRKLLLEVRNIRRCEDGHTCNLVANGRRVAFVGPGIFEWSTNSAKVDVIDWFSAQNNIKGQPLQPKELKDGWEAKEPEYRIDKKEEETERRIIQWVNTHIKAWEIWERCKKTIITLSSSGAIYDWEVSPKLLGSSVTLQDIMVDGKTSYLLNGLSSAEIAKLMVTALG